MNKEKLKKEVWSKENYYKTAGEGSLDSTHPAMKKLQEVASESTTILDMGCGEGTRLHSLVGEDKKGFGVDISSKAIDLAKKKYPELNFKTGDLEKLPYGDGEFDLVYSAFVFEHLDDPEKVINEGIRVLKRGGKFLIVAPNYGAPNRASPPFKGNRLKKLFTGIVNDFIGDGRLRWQKVIPIATSRKYEMDWDTTVEPYLGSLKKYFKKRGFKIFYTSSVWEKEDDRASLMQKIIRFLGQIGLYPFKHWGPHMLLVAEKFND